MLLKQTHSSHLNPRRNSCHHHAVCDSRGRALRHLDPQNRGEEIPAAAIRREWDFSYHPVRGSAYGRE